MLFSNGLLKGLCLIVRRADIQEFALNMAIYFDISLDVFKASNHWLNNFLLRYELSQRRGTTMFKLEDDEVIKRAISFKSYIDGIDFSKYNLSNMIAMDETAVLFGKDIKIQLKKRCFFGLSSLHRL